MEPVARRTNTSTKAKRRISPIDTWFFPGFDSAPERERTGLFLNCFGMLVCVLDFRDDNFENYRLPVWNQ
jgi:hypothetical protein